MQSIDLFFAFVGCAFYVVHKKKKNCPYQCQKDFLYIYLVSRFMSALREQGELEDEQEYCY